MVLFLMGVHSSVFAPIKYSIPPRVLDPHARIGGNGLVEIATALAILPGMVADGVAIWPAARTARGWYRRWWRWVLVRHAATRRTPGPQAIQLPSTSSAANTSHMISTRLSKWARSSSSPATSVASTA